MSTSFATLLRGLLRILYQFDPASKKEKTALLKALHKEKLPGDSVLRQYHEVLLYCSAYPHDKAFLRLVEMELQRIGENIRTKRSLYKQLHNTGLPYTQTVSFFSFDLVQWLLQQKELAVSLDSIQEDPSYLNEALRQTLPETEVHLTSLEYTHELLFEALGISIELRLPFLLSELSKISSPRTRDFFFDKTGLQISVIPKHKTFSRAFNRLQQVEPYFHEALLKQFDHLALINTPLPSPENLDTTKTAQLIKVIRYDLALLGRETDPATYLASDSLRYYLLDRGISIALYTMMPERQLPLESYVGYTLFKNGYPTAYGGSWVLGRYALFGINVHDSFRGGESGYIFSQLLRVYRQLFQIDYFEVESYQFGKDNPEGITSGAYWFYYKYGFRSVDKSLYRLAEKEYRKIKQKPGYRTSQRTLQKFTDSNVALEFAKGIPPTVYDFTERITHMIADQYIGDRVKAIEDCMGKFRSQTDPTFFPDADQRHAYTDFALLHQALLIRSRRKSSLLFEIAKMKSQDVYRYQELLREFLAEESK